ncbi:MAG: hypothetical protein QXG03_13820 [Halalkalicoccus sp.]
MLETWTLEIVFALVTVQLLVLFYLAYRRRTEASTSDADAEFEGRSGPRAGSDSPSEGEPLVVCRTCGAENDPAYHYCRECVSDLDGESIPGYRTHSPSERSL